MTEFEDVACQRLSWDVTEELPRVPWYERALYMAFLAMAALGGVYVFALLMFSLDQR